MSTETDIHSREAKKELERALGLLETAEWALSHCDWAGVDASHLSPPLMPDLRAYLTRHGRKVTP